jgi:hypothetical protein
MGTISKQYQIVATVPPVILNAVKDLKKVV